MVDSSLEKKRGAKAASALLNGATRCLETQPLFDYTAALNSNYYCRQDPCACLCVCVLHTNECVTFDRSIESEREREKGRENEREREKNLCCDMQVVNIIIYYTYYY